MFFGHRHFQPLGRACLRPPHEESPFYLYQQKQVEAVADKVIPVFDKALYSNPFKVHFTAFFYLPVVEQLKHEDV